MAMFNLKHIFYKNLLKKNKRIQFVGEFLNVIKTNKVFK